VDFVIFDAIGADGLKGSEADVECDFGGIDAALAEAVENFGGEVESGGGGGDGTGVAGEDGLVAITVVGGIGARDIRREGDVADTFEDGEEIIDGMEADVTFAELGASDNFGLEFVALAEEEALADSDFSAGTNQALPIVGIAGKLAGEKNLNAGAERIASGRARRAERLGAQTFAAAV
jgi:hypothetical protein